jgi:hypothetical protein
MQVGEEVLTCLEKATEASKGASWTGTGRRTRNGSVGGGSGGDAGRG